MILIIILSQKHYYMSLYTPKVVRSSVAEDVCSLLFISGCPRDIDVCLSAVAARCES